jgi:peptidyl-prolyl cis-trans isomerase C
MKFRTLTLALSMAGLLGGCDQMPGSMSASSKTAESTPVIVDTSTIVAKVNGVPITETVLDLYRDQLQGRNMNADMSDTELLDEVINLELASQQGNSEGLDKDTRTQLQIAQQRRAVLASAAIRHYMDSKPITDEELQKLYDEKVPKGDEYKARHILVKTEDEAKKLIAELDGGADFSELAKTHSTDPAGKSGGDLGWFSPQQMVAPFSEATSKLEKGSYTKEPVQTQFGWHIIILDDVRASTPPPLEQVKPQLQAFIQKQRVEDYINQLRTGAAIEIVTPPAETPAPAADAEPSSSGSAESYSEE